MQPGIIYVQYATGHYSSLVKIGKTRFDVSKRNIELFTTGMPEPLQIAHVVYVHDIDKAERIVHQRLKPHRYRADREFFRVSIEDAIATVEAVAKDMRLIYPVRGDGNMRQLHQSIRLKLHADIRGSLLSDSSTACAALTEMATRSAAIWSACRLKTSTLANLFTDATHISEFRPSLFAGHVLAKDIQTIVSTAPHHRTITASVACNSTAAVLAMLVLRDRLEREGIQVEIDYSQTSGRNLLLAAFAAPRADLLVVGQPAFAFAQLSAQELALSRDVRTGYTAYLPLHREGQVLLVPRRTSMKNVKRIYTASRSATEEPHLTGRIHPLLTTRRPEVKYRDADELLAGRIPIAPGAALQIWKPAHSALAKVYDLVQVNGFNYDHWIGVFVRAELLRKSPSFTEAIAHVFCATWNKLCRAPERYLPVLFREDKYVEAFRISSGLQ